MTGIIRAFIAAELPREIKKDLVSAAGVLGEGSDRIRYVSAENIHITVMFLGDVNVSLLEKIKDDIGVAAAGYKHFEVSIKGIDVFPDSRRPRVIWGKLDKGREPLRNIYRDLGKRLEYLNLKEGKMAYVPHATVARIRYIKEIERFNRALFGCAGKIFGRCLIKKISLFQSVLSPAGPVYRKLYDGLLKNQE